MSTTDSTTNGRPAKPNADFPLYAHKSGRWAKKVRGKTHFFGPWRDPDGALRRYLAEKGDLEAARRPQRGESGGVKDSGKPTTTSCPGKPYPAFPLYAHRSGRWAKKIRGKTHFFGPWRDSHKALTRYLAEKDDLEAGRKPQHSSATSDDVLTVEQMVSLYIEAKKLCVESGEMGRRTLQEYRTYGMRMIRVFGANTPIEQLGPQDFKRYRADLQKTHKSLATLAADVRKTLVYFNWAGPGAHGQGLIDRLPRFGDAMRPPSAAALVRERNAEGAASLHAGPVAYRAGGGECQDASHDITRCQLWLWQH